MYDPNSIITGKVPIVTLRVHQSHLAVNSTKMTFKKYVKNSILIRQGKLQSSCHAVISPFIPWFQKNHPRKEFDRLIKQQPERICAFFLRSLFQ